MQQVFLGQSADGQPVAVKVIRPEPGDDFGFRARFRRQVTAAKKVSSEFTAEVVDADMTGPRPWLATAYVAGPSLAEVVREYGPLPLSSLLTLAAGLAAGLRAIAATGLMHGDLKPSNVLLAEDRPRMIDFGISSGDTVTVTDDGLVIASPAFMSPEQAEGGDAGPASDVFRLGMVLAFAATGQEPFGAPKTAALAYRVVHGSPDLGGVPEEMRSLVERCLAKDPGQRPTPTDLLAEIGPARPGADWLPASVTRGIAGYMLPEPQQAAWPPQSDTEPPVAGPVAGRSDLPATSPLDGYGAAPAAVTKTATVIRAKGSAARTLLKIGAVAVAAAVAVTLIVVALAGHTGTPRPASRPTHPALAQRSSRPSSAPVHLAAWSVAQRISGADAFAAISCPAATFCMAADTGGSVYRYSSGSWSGPRQLTTGTLTAVSCATVSFCAATGPSGRTYLYSGGSWSAAIQLTGADGNPADLKWVSCPAAGFCLAAGKWDAYTYSAGQWATGHQLQQTFTFASISCPADNFCIAADSGGNIYTYSNGSWSGPRQVSTGALTAVSCATVSFCAATGPSGRAYVYSGGNWSAPIQLTAADGHPADLRSVSCPAAGTCLAAGKGDAYTYSAGRWAVGHLIEADRIFSSISCPAASFCIAADTGGNVYTYSAG
jgi:hypothetical protein